MRLKALQTGIESIDGLLLVVAIWWQRSGRAATLRDAKAARDKIVASIPPVPFLRRRGSAPGVLAPRDLRKTPGG